MLIRLDVSLVRCVRLVAVILVTGSFALPAAGSSVPICHVPPGNPDNAHTLNVSPSSVKAHLGHGDYVGPCSEDPGETGDDLAELLSPLPGSTLSGSTVTFEWSAADFEDARYWLRIGSTPGGTEWSNDDMEDELSAVVDDLPEDGSTIHVELWTEIDGEWAANIYEYTAYNGEDPGEPDGGPAQLTSHEDGDTLAGAGEIFTWDHSPDATQYFIWIGSLEGAYDIYLDDAGTNLSATISGLPTDGRTLYFRLWSKIDGVWDYTDTVLIAATEDPGGGLAELTSHEDGDTLSGDTETFVWSPAPDATQYYVWIGSSEGDYDIYLEDRGTALSATVNGLPADGRTLYFRLWSRIGGAWEYVDYTFTAASGGGSADPAELTSHEDGDTLSGSDVTFTWSESTTATQYFIWIGSTPGEYDIALEDAGTSLSLTITNLPTDGDALYLRLWSKINEVWEYHDYVLQASTG